MRVVFAGTPDFAATALKALIDHQFNVVGVYTQPDKPKGRKQQLTASPVKVLAQDNGIEVFQPATLKQPDDQAVLAALKPDVMVVAAYGLLLPKAVLDIPTYGCLNIHASILPRWRGAAPIQYAIMAGDTETGVTLMRMTEGLDTGPMWQIAKCPITPTTTTTSLMTELAEMGGKLLVKHLPSLSHETPFISQDDSAATHAPKITKAQAILDFQDTAQSLHAKVCALNPWPGTTAELDGARIKLLQTHVSTESHDAGKTTCGEIIGASKDGLHVACGQGSVLCIERLQLPGKKPVTAEAFVNGLQTSVIGKQLFS